MVFSKQRQKAVLLTSLKKQGEFQFGIRKPKLGFKAIKKISKGFKAKIPKILKRTTSIIKSAKKTVFNPNRRVFK